jgi:hypothetical protein
MTLVVGFRLGGDVIRRLHCLEDRKREHVPRGSRSRSTFYMGIWFPVFPVDTFGEECICILVALLGRLHTGKVF